MKTNMNPETDPTLEFHTYSTMAHVVERLLRVDPDIFRYVTSFSDAFELISWKLIDFRLPIWYLGEESMQNFVTTCLFTHLFFSFSSSFHSLSTLIATSSTPSCFNMYSFACTFLVGIKDLNTSFKFGFKYIITLTDALITRRRLFRDKEMSNQIGTPPPCCKIASSLFGSSSMQSSPTVIKMRNA